MAEKERLDVLIVNKGLAASRELAKAYIMAGNVYVDGNKEDKAGTKVEVDSAIEIRGGQMPYVSRGGFKLEKAMEVFPVSLDGKGDVEFPDVLPATPDVMVEFFQSGVPVATPTTFLTNVNTMETWPLLQGAAEAGEVRKRLDDVFRMTLDRQAGKSLQAHSQE